MRRRMIIILAIGLALGLTALATPRPTRALQAWIHKIKSDCSTIKVSTTLVYLRDDTSDDTEKRDYFRLEIYDEFFNVFLKGINESITQDQSPYYWQTHRIESASWKDGYRVEVWDINRHGEKKRLLEQVYFRCSTGASWRKEPSQIDPNPQVPNPKCESWVTLFTTNLAPEKGAVLVMWSWGTELDDLSYHLYTIEVEPNEGLNHTLIRAPCGTYLRLYFQPNSTKLLYYMPSQYWPHDAFGTPLEQDGKGPVYHTFFPLDGPERPPDD